MTNLSQNRIYLRDDTSLAAVREAADLPEEHSQNGQPGLSFRGMRLHSNRNPQAEADALIDSHRDAITRALRETDQEVICLIPGPGLGYCFRSLELLAEQLGAQDRLSAVACELEPEIARRALNLRVWEPGNLGIQWFVGVASYPSLREALHDRRVVLLKGAASFRVHRQDYERLEGVSVAKAAERPMRVLVPTPLYGGSYPAALHSADALKKLGHQVELLDLSDYYPLFRHAESATINSHHRRALQGILTTYLAELVAARAIAYRADLVWCVAQTPLTPAALQEMRHEGIHSAFWFVEDFRVLGYWRELAPHFDAVFTIQRGEFFEALNRIGVRHAAYLPCAVNPDVHKPLDLCAEEKARFGSPVSFVGAGYANRQRLFSELPLPGLKIWGNDWPGDIPASRFVQENGRRVSTEETARIFCASTINLNLHSSPHYAGLNPQGDFVNPRTFEVAACGGFQIVDDRAELPAMFEPGREITVVRREEDVPRLVEYYLTHDAERTEIAAQARRRVLSEHTYEHRLAEALRFLEARYPRLTSRKRGPNYISSLKEAVADDGELVEFLSNFDENEEVDLDRIVERIRLGSGELKRAEGLFLLMKEFRDWGREKGVIR